MWTDVNQQLNRFVILLCFYLPASLIFTPSSSWEYWWKLRLYLEVSPGAAPHPATDLVIGGCKAAAAPGGNCTVCRVNFSETHTWVGGFISNVKRSCDHIPPCCVYTEIRWKQEEQKAASCVYPVAQQHLCGGGTSPEMKLVSPYSEKQQVSLQFSVRALSTSLTSEKLV